MTGFSELLTVTPLGDDAFRAQPPGEGFLFGGLTMGLALQGAAATVPEHLVAKSIHCTFIRAGRWGPELRLAVTRVSDTRSFANRRVEVIEEGTVLAVAHASFHQPEAGADWHGGFDLTDGPDQATPLRIPMGPVTPAEVRLIRSDAVTPEASIPHDTIHPYWARPIEPCPPQLLTGAVTFVSDYFVINTPFPTSGTGAGMISRTLEHAIWFHRPSPDGWLVYDARPMSVSGGRFVSLGTVHDPRGALIASFVQEGIVRAQRVPG